MGKVTALSIYGLFVDVKCDNVFILTKKAFLKILKFWDLV